jgi:hypothetical protein
MADESKNQIPGLTPKRRQLLQTMTVQESAAASKAWREHSRRCRADDLVPTPLAVFVIEWLEIARTEAARPTSEAPEDSCRHESRDYWKPFATLGEK